MLRPISAHKYSRGFSFSCTSFVVFIVLLPFLALGGGSAQQLKPSKTNYVGIRNANSCGEAGKPDWCSGSDVGAWVNSAYESLPANGGSITISIPPGGLQFSTGIKIDTADKPAIIQCYGASGAPSSRSSYGLLYTASSGVALTFDYGGNGKFHHRGAGLRDCNFVGSGGNSIGLLTGGRNGAEGLLVTNSHIGGFGVQWRPGNNAWQIKFDHSYLSGPGRLVNIPDALSNAGEHFVFSDTSFMGNGTFIGGVTLGGKGTQFDCINCSFDDVQVRISRGTASTSLVNPHFENPGLPVAAPFLTNEGGNVTLMNPQVLQDFPTSTASAILEASAGTTVIIGMDSASPSYTYPALFALSGTANLYIIAPTTLGGSNNVFVSGSTSGRYLIDTGNGCRQYPCQTLLTNKTLAIQAPSLRFTGLGDLYGRLGFWQTQPTPDTQDFVAVTAPNSSDYEDGIWGHIKLVPHNNAPCRGYYSNEWQFWTTSGTSRGYTRDNSNLVATIDCAGNAILKGQYFAGRDRNAITDSRGYVREITAALKTTAKVSDTVELKGMNSFGHCQLTPTNALAAKNFQFTYVSEKHTDSITIHHASIPGMTYDVLCSPN